MEENNGVVITELEPTSKKGLGGKIAIGGLVVAGLAAGAVALVKKFGYKEDYIDSEVIDDDFEDDEDRPIISDSDDSEEVEK